MPHSWGVSTLLVRLAVPSLPIEQPCTRGPSSGAEDTEKQDGPLGCLGSSTWEPFQPLHSAQWFCGDVASGMEVSSAGPTGVLVLRPGTEIVSPGWAASPPSSRSKGLAPDLSAAPPLGPLPCSPPPVSFRDSCLT